MADVKDYEEKHPRVVTRVDSGYPRFTTHKFIRQISANTQARHNLGQRPVVFAASERSAHELAHFAGLVEHHVEYFNGLYGVILPADDAETLRQASHFLQHTGTGLSSREAEDWLHKQGILSGTQPEELAGIDSESRVLSALRPIIGARDTSCLRLCRGGMNGFYASFRTLRDIQAQKGRHRWIQLGWLYVDTHCILNKWLPPDRPPHFVHNVMDLTQLENMLAEIG